MWSLPVETGSNLIRLLMIFLKVIPLSSLDVILDYGELGNFRFIMHSYTVLISQGKMSRKSPIVRFTWKSSVWLDLRWYCGDIFPTTWSPTICHQVKTFQVHSSSSSSTNESFVLIIDVEIFNNLLGLIHSCQQVYLWSSPGSASSSLLMLFPEEWLFL